MRNGAQKVSTADLSTGAFGHVRGIREAEPARTTTQRMPNTIPRGIVFQKLFAVTGDGDFARTSSVGTWNGAGVGSEWRGRKTGK